jgi:uncharacterized membrane protein HdeD (DUF308 family)
MHSTKVDRELAGEVSGTWWLFLVTGILWILFAWIVLSINYSTVWAVAIYFGLGLIGGGLMSIFLGSQAGSWRWLHITLGVIAIVAGVVALLWPNQTFLVLAAIIGWYLMFSGIIDMVTAFATRADTDLWWLQLILGIVQILIGFWAIGYEGRSIALLVIWVGATALARGISCFFIAFGLHHAGKELRQRMAPGAPLPPPSGPAPA